MKIAYLSSSIIPSRTANSIHVMKMCQAFVKNGHEVVLFARNSREKMEDEYKFYGVDKCFKMERTKWPGVRGLGGLIYGYSICKKFFDLTIPDLLYSRDIYSLFLLRKLNVPFIYESHTPPENRVRYYLENVLFTNKNFSRLVVISDALRLEYLKRFPKLSSERMIVAHDGADIPSNDLNKTMNYYNLKDNKINVGYIGHLYQGRGMEVIEQLAEHLSDIDFHVIGGTEKDINYWKGRINFKNMFFYGFVPHGKLPDYYNSFDIMLAPYQKRVSGSGGRGDTVKWMSPLKVFEYMSFGKPIIASDLPVLKEVLKDKYNCLLCKPDDSIQWKNAITLLLNDIDLKQRIKINAWNDFIKNYTWESRAKKVLGRLVNQ